jgi:hypothetical protein
VDIDRDGGYDGYQNVVVCIREEIMSEMYVECCTT